MTIAFAVCATLMVAASVLWLLRPLGPLGPLDWFGTAAGSRPLKLGTTGRSLALLVPCAAFVLYARLGNVGALSPPPIDATRAMAERMVAQLAARLHETPDDLRGWRTLARSYVQLHREADAAAAFRRLVELQPDDPDALVDLAEASAALQGGRLAGQPIAQINRALAIDPDHARALAIAANEAGERNDVTAAIGFWEHLRSRSTPGSAIARAIESNLEEARRELAQRTTAVEFR